MPKQPRSSTSTDKYIGNRIKIRRQELRISQSDLGEGIGVSFQQIQKYETGKNRVTVSRLSLIATALKTTPEALMEGMPGASGKAPANSMDSASITFLTSDEGPAIVRALNSITSPTLRRAVKNVVVSMAGVAQAAE